MNEQIKIFLEDIYLVEPNLRNREDELLEIVGNLIKLQPEIVLDEKFKEELLKKFLQKAENFSINKSFNFIHMFNNYKIGYWAGAIGILALLIVPTVFWFNGQKINSFKTSGSFQVAYNPPNAFGSLLGGVGTSGGAQPLNTMSASESTGLKADSSVSYTTGALVGRGGGGVAVGSSGSVDSIKMIAPIYYNPVMYKYVFDGELNLPEADSLPVLKRNLGAGYGQETSGILSAFNLNLINLSAFNNSEVQFISLSEKKEGGYNISIDLNNESVSIGKNWVGCIGEVCAMEYQPLTEKDMMEDAGVIAIAEEFLRKMKVDITAYGQPYVRDNWRQNYLLTADKTNFYFPETSSVVFPFIFDGKKVYEQYGGEPDGLSVNVNVKTKQVADVYNLRTQNYLSSAYEIVKDEELILKIAGQGGTGMYVPETAEKIVELKLVDPQLVWARIWKYDLGKSEEILVPALMFSVENPPAEMYYKRNVVVPLLKDLLINENNNYPRPMPLIREGGGEAGVVESVDTGAIKF